MWNTVCAFGFVSKWFKYCIFQKKLIDYNYLDHFDDSNKENDDEDPIRHFHILAKLYFQGKLKGPFNKEARDSIGMTQQWYLPLT